MALVDEEPPGTVFYPPPHLSMKAHVGSLDDYKTTYQASLAQPEHYWENVASDLYWKTPRTGAVLKSNLDVRKGPISTQFMEGATTNICYNALDRNIENGKGNKVAYYW